MNQNSSVVYKPFRFTNENIEYEIQIPSIIGTVKLPEFDLANEEEYCCMFSKVAPVDDILDLSFLVLIQDSKNKDKVLCSLEQKQLGYSIANSYKNLLCNGSSVFIRCCLFGYNYYNNSLDGKKYFEDKIGNDYLDDELYEQCLINYSYELEESQKFFKKYSITGIHLKYEKV